MENIALGTKLFSRTEDLQELLATLPQDTVSKVYVAHDGKWTDEKERVFDLEYSVEVSLIDLEYDAGVSAGKNAIIERCDEPFLLMVDTDHRVPPAAKILAEQLKERPELGGIAGSIIEPDNQRLWQSAKNLYESGSGLVRDVPDDVVIEMAAGEPFVKFDFVPSAILLRTECLEDYHWDESYTVGSEHLDFHVGHWKAGEWKFAINPGVLFEHYPGGDQTYIDNRHGENVRKGRKYFLQKWEYDFVRDKQAYWFDTASGGIITEARRRASRSLPTPLYLYAKRVYDNISNLK